MKSRIRFGGIVSHMWETPVRSTSDGAGTRLLLLPLSLLAGVCGLVEAEQPLLRFFLDLEPRPGEGVVVSRTTVCWAVLERVDLNAVQDDVVEVD